MERILEKQTIAKSIWEITTTAGDQATAIKIAEALIDAHLAACVQIVGPIRSIYRWKGSVHNDEEWKCNVKTISAAVDACIAKIREVHPYEVPEIIANPIAKCLSEYESWAESQIDVKKMELGLLNQVSMESAVDNTLQAVIVGNRPEPSQIVLKSPWHIQIQGRSDDAIVDRSKPGSMILPTGPRQIDLSFEFVAQKLEQWDGMFFEMDGSFVWRSKERKSVSENLWQLDGMLYDRAGKVEYVELKGSCSREAWKKISDLLSQEGGQPLMVYAVNHGFWLEVEQFEAIAFVGG